MTTKRTRKTTTVPPATIPVSRKDRVENNIKKLFKKLTEIKITAKYCIEQLLYLFVILFAAIVIQNMWNYIDKSLLNGQYPITTFEAAVLWICIY